MLVIVPRRPIYSSIYASICSCVPLRAPCIHVAGGCSRLVALDASQCTALSDGALASVAKYCSSLTDLRLAQCCKITDRHAHHAVADTGWPDLDWPAPLARPSCRSVLALLLMLERCVCLLRTRWVDSRLAQGGSAAEHAVCGSDVARPAWNGGHRRRCGGPLPYKLCTAVLSYPTRMTRTGHGAD